MTTIQKVEHRGMTFWVDEEKPNRLRYGPGGKYEWIDMPSSIIHLESHRTGFIIRLSGGGERRLEGINPDTWCLRIDEP